MAWRLFPEENRSLELLSAMARMAVEATSCVAQIVGSPQEDHESVLEEALEIERRCTDQFFALMTTVRSSFVTPLPRGDLYLLGRHLNTTIESLVGATSVIQTLKLDTFSDRSAELLDLIHRQASLTSEAMRHLADLKGLEEYWVEVMRMSKQFSRTSDRYRSYLLERAKTSTYIKYSHFVDKLENASNALRAVATEVGRILVQEG